MTGLVVGLIWTFNGHEPQIDTPLPLLHVDTLPPQAQVQLVDTALTGTPLAVRLEGRRAVASDGVWHQWPGFAAEGRFDGPAVSMRLADATNRLRVVIDDGASGKITLVRPGTKTIEISGLPAGPHQVRVETLSEADRPARFVGFATPSGGQALPVAAALPRIAFIGDSDTVGYGNTGHQRECSGTQVFAETDTTQSFPARVGQALKAEVTVTARSGVGLLRNYGGSAGPTMAALYPLAIPDRPDLPDDPPGAVATLVVGLGSNDLGSPFAAEEKWGSNAALQSDFQNALIAFLKARQSEMPGARIVLLSFTEYGEEMITSYRAAEAALRDAGSEVALIELPKLERKGCHWHPSLKDHALIADLLIKAIDSKQ
ncbi:SGNH/GDSL hydrolase family protein [Paracoccus aminophilus]|nr:SGNH/GDSL hydrolase family protein [Paracoccus aminophilus]